MLRCKVSAHNIRLNLIILLINLFLKSQALLKLLHCNQFLESYTPNLALVKLSTILPPDPNPVAKHTNEVFSKQLIASIQRGTASLEHIELSHKRILESLVRVNNIFTDMERRMKRSSSDTHTISSDKDLGIHSQYQFRLDLKSEIVKLIYKKKPFGLRFGLTDLNGENYSLPEESLFRIELWLASSPSIKLDRTHKGSQLIDGCTEVKSRGTIEFKKLYINDVSSHFSNGCFTLVVRSENSVIQPFVFHNFIVRARKPTQRELSKKAKLVC